MSEKNLIIKFSEFGASFLTLCVIIGLLYCGFNSQISSNNPIFQKNLKDS